MNMLKTNAIRILAQHKINYEELSYIPDDEFKNGLETAQKLNIPVNLVYKTIVCCNQKKFFVSKEIFCFNNTCR